MFPYIHTDAYDISYPHNRNLNYQHIYVYIYKHKFEIYLDTYEIDVVEDKILVHYQDSLCMYHLDEKQLNLI
jgi:hypothetical protein